MAALALLQSAFAFHLPAASRCGIALPLAHASSRGALHCVSAAFSDFSAFEKEVRSYLQTLSDEALNDPEAPSPLSYTELQANGRVDLVEGAMQYGGYLAVSSKLGVRIQKVKEKSGPKQGYRDDGGVQFTADDAEDSKANVVLSAQAKEDKMAADLARLASSGGAGTARGGGSSAGAGGGASTWEADRQLTPLKTGSAAENAQQSDTLSTSAVADGNDGARYIRLDGLQRANMLLLLGLLSVGFGAASEGTIEASTISTAQLAGSVLVVAHVAIAGFAAFSASQATQSDENPVLWFIKCLLTGAGGLSELKRRLQA